LIIAILLQELVQSGPIRAGVLEFQLEAESGKELGEFSEAQLAATSVFEGVERSPADAGLVREPGLAKLQLLAMLGYLSSYGD
jgi:hypothetical protein